MSAKKKPAPRGYGLTPWSKGFLLAVEGPAELRKITKARTYFRDRNVIDLVVRSGRVTGLVQGSQLDPFEVEIEADPADPATVVAMLRERGKADELVSVTRGKQPETLGSLVIPADSTDIRTECTCPVDDDRCIHVLAVSYELAATIDKEPATLLTIMGADLPLLLAHLRDNADRLDERTTDSPAPTEVDFYGDGRQLPGLPHPPPLDVLSELDTTALSAALRRSGAAAMDVAQAVDELAELYARITR
ncbi:putative Zn finger protein [Williamsia limnetica]|uniref:Putative Zn finger protein n=1 Tax=Williamsia limnetica TaxID=882452 RepID=A0A318RLQ2_WILLI|nr:SWIM zinc finger family protein [Williamsia limnetica]PYE17969.1 putative Zn finger protein [Williamsia limnetica]